MADPTEVEQDDDHRESSVVKELRAEIKRLKKDAEDAPLLRQEVALVKAGLDGLNEKQVKALLSAHDGDLTAEALKATATEIGFAVTPGAEAEVDPEQAQRDQEVSEMSRFAGSPASAGAAVLSSDDVVKQINEFTSPEALRDFMLANPDLFTTGAT